ncbi:pyridoxamine 5'-phosphate oxidase family protein [Terrabacter sp. MAHUQ-38]|uniref:pyridoxamine 5'-phosphate oxidase family protein n=1 Tax=unclassified Terrabacter TaxID=2630222 RepID=UPI00165DADB4|nr:pyridoxamine 5'-phosphate oxidase family protein [Terrabacter sp. MAHUQ-38]
MNGDILPTDHTGLQVLDTESCLERVRRTPVGRIAFELDGEIAVLPVVHTVDGLDICFRTAGNAKLEMALEHDRVAYEVDQWDPDSHSGWSVLVQGTASIVDDEDEVRRLEQVSGGSWIPQHRQGYRWVRVRAHTITGRLLEPPADG